MTLFPFFEDIVGKTFLVIGGGNVAREKVSRLKLFTDRIVVIAEHTDIIDVEVLRKPFADEDLALGDYVIGATDAPALNARISELCIAQGKPVNIVDDPEKCTFVFPSVIRRGDLTVAISTNGKTPVFAKYLREQIEAILPERTGDLIDTLYELRQILKSTVPSQAQRAAILNAKLAELLEEAP